MSRVEIGQPYVFHYPENGDLPGYPERRGSIVTPLEATEHDDTQVLYAVEAGDGWRGHAYARELEPVDPATLNLIRALWRLHGAATWICDSSEAAGEAHNVHEDEFEEFTYLRNANAHAAEVLEAVIGWQPGRSPPEWARSTALATATRDLQCQT